MLISWPADGINTFFVAMWCHTSSYLIPLSKCFQVHVAFWEPNETMYLSWFYKCFIIIIVKRLSGGVTCSTNPLWHSMPLTISGFIIDYLCAYLFWCTCWWICTVHIKLSGVHILECPTEIKYLWVFSMSWDLSYSFEFYQFVSLVPFQRSFVWLWK